MTIFAACDVLKPGYLVSMLVVNSNSLTFSCGMNFRPLSIYDRLSLFHDLVVPDSLRSITLMNPRKQTLTYNGNSTRSFAIFSQPAVVKSDFFFSLPIGFSKVQLHCSMSFQVQVFYW